MSRRINNRFALQQYEQETLNYKARVETAGGVVLDIEYVDAVYKLLKALNLLTVLKYFTSYKAGIRKDSAGAVSKLFSLDLNGNDVKQTNAGSLQPIYYVDGIHYSGRYLEALGNTNFNVLGSDKLTIGAETIPDTTSGFGTPFANMDTTKAYNGYDLWYEGTQFGSHIIHLWNTDALKILTGGGLVVGENINTTITYDGLKKAAGVKAYKNATNLATTANPNNLTSDPIGSSVFVMGARWGGTSITQPFNGKIKKAYIFKAELTSAQIAEINAL